jgi:hypothetical protein
VSRRVIVEVLRMIGRIGDRIIIDSERVGQAARSGEILEAIETDYGPRYRVRWEDGHETEIRPHAGSARIESVRAPAHR